MTPARKKALEWFHDRGEASNREVTDYGPRKPMLSRMFKDGQIHTYTLNGVYHIALTDAGRRALNGDSK